MPSPSTSLKRRVSQTTRHTASAVINTSITTAIQGPGDAVLGEIRGLPGVEKADTGERPGEYRVIGSPDADLGAQIFRLAVDKGWTVSTIAPEQHSLEDVYLSLTAGPGQAAGSAQAAAS